MPSYKNIFDKLLKNKPIVALFLSVLLFLAYQLTPNIKNASDSKNVNVNQVFVEDIETNELLNEEPVGFTGTKNMNVCQGDSEICHTRKVEFENGEVIMIYLSDSNIIAIDYSDCQDDYCYAEDEDGGEWDLVE